MSVIPGPWPPKPATPKPDLERSSWWLVAAGALFVFAAKFTGVI